MNHDENEPGRLFVIPDDDGPGRVGLPDSPASRGCLSPLVWLLLALLALLAFWSCSRNGSRPWGPSKSSPSPVTSVIPVEVAEIPLEKSPSPSPNPVLSPSPTSIPPAHETATPSPAASPVEVRATPRPSTPSTPAGTEPSPDGPEPTSPAPTQDAPEPSPAALPPSPTPRLETTPSATPEEDASGSIAQHGILVLVNETSITLAIQLEGPTTESLEIKTGESEDLKLIPGRYFIVVRDSRAPESAGGSRHAFHLATNQPTTMRLRSSFSFVEN